MRLSTRVAADGAVTLVVGGTMNATCVADFDRALELARHAAGPVVVDLGSVWLIDHPTLQYLADLQREDVRLIHCPDYLERCLNRPSCR